MKKQIVVVILLYCLVMIFPLAANPMNNTKEIVCVSYTRENWVSLRDVVKDFNIPGQNIYWDHQGKILLIQDGEILIRIIGDCHTAYVGETELILKSLPHVEGGRLIIQSEDLVILFKHRLLQLEKGKSNLSISADNISQQIVEPDWYKDYIVDLSHV